MIYFDNSSTTCCDKDIADLIAKTMTENFGNPSSLHNLGVNAQMAFEKAERQVLKALNAKDGRVIFTSGGTESNNLAVFGSVNALKKRGKRVITSSIEHSSVLTPFQQLEKEGFDVVFLECDSFGRVSLEKLKEALTPDTILVSCMLVNNEVGTIQDIKKMVKLTHEIAPNAYFHTDAVQAFGKIPVDVRNLGVDLLSMSGHKINCSKGIGALYIKDKIRICPIIYGGGQQEKIKPGTENVPLAVGFGQAAFNACNIREKSAENALLINKALREELAKIPAVHMISPESDVSPFIICFSLENYKAETLLHFLEEKEIYLSSGSACSKGKESHVLKAMGVDPFLIKSSLRISLGKYNDISEVRPFIEALNEAVSVLRKIK